VADARYSGLERWMAEHAVVGAVVSAIVVGSLTSHFFIDGGSLASQVRDGLIGAFLAAIPWWYARERSKVH
jgi:hypothetical protein